MTAQTKFGPHVTFNHTFISFFWIFLSTSPCRWMFAVALILYQMPSHVSGFGTGTQSTLVLGPLDYVLKSFAHKENYHTTEPHSILLQHFICLTSKASLEWSINLMCTPLDTAAQRWTEVVYVQISSVLCNPSSNHKHHHPNNRTPNPTDNFTMHMVHILIWSFKLLSIKNTVSCKNNRKAERI